MEEARAKKLRTEPPTAVDLRNLPEAPLLPDDLGDVLVPAYLPSTPRGEEDAPEAKRGRRSDQDEQMMLEINLLQGVWEPISRGGAKTASNSSGRP